MKNKKYIGIVVWLIILVVLIAGGVFAYNKLRNEVQSDNLSVNEKDENEEEIKAVSFKMYDREGKEVQLSDYYGKPIVLNFWASWCPPCKDEMPHFNTVYKEKGEEITFLMLNVTDGMSETRSTAEVYLDTQDFEFPVFFDEAGEGSYIYQIYSLPTTLFIDKDGNIIAGAQGAITEEQLRSGIEQIQ